MKTVGKFIIITIITSLYSLITCIINNEDIRIDTFFANFVIPLVITLFLTFIIDIVEKVTKKQFPDDLTIFIRILIAVTIFLTVMNLTVGKKKRYGSILYNGLVETIYVKDTTYKIDTINRIYSNFKYGISYKYPKNWEFDNGVSKKTIFRTYQKDSTTTFSITAFDTKMSKEEKKMIDNNIWLLTDNDNYRTQEKEKFEKELQTNIADYKYEKVYLRNLKAKKVSFTYLQKDITGMYLSKDISLQVIKDGIFYTIGLSVPKELYLKRPAYYDNFFTQIHFIPKS